MNTNYSKIALLLALGVIAGDKVGADLGVNHVEGAQFNSDLRKSVVKGHFLDVLNKIHDNSKSQQLSKYLRDIQEPIFSRNRVAVRFGDFIDDTSLKLNAEGQAVFGLKDDALVPFLKDQKAKKGLEQDIKDGFKSLSADIKEIVDSSKATTALDVSKINMIRIESNSKLHIDDFVARSSKSRISESLKSGIFVKNLLEGISYRTLHSDSIARLLSKEQAKLSQQINELVGDISVVASDAGAPRVNVRAALVSLNNGIHDWTAGLSKSLLDARDANQGDLENLSRAGKRLGLAATFLAGMNVNPGKPSAGATLLAGACDSSRGSDTERGAMVTVLKAAPGAGDDHSKALATYLSKITGETPANLNTVANNVLYYGAGDTAATANASRVALAELGSAFDVAAPGVSNFDSAAMDDTNVKKLIAVFTPLDDLRKNLGNVKTKAAKSLTSYEIIRQNSQGRDVGFTLSSPSWNLAKKDDASIEQIVLYFDDVTKRIADLKNTSAGAFKAVSGEWEKTLTAAYNTIGGFIQQKSIGLMGTGVAADDTGIIAGMNKGTIDQAQLKIKAAYDEAIAALGTVPAAAAQAAPVEQQVQTDATKAAADKLAAVKTVAELEALDIFQKGGLKVSDLSDAIKTLITEEKDPAKAQTLFAKILKGCDLKGENKGTTITALKTLFDAKIRGSLSVEEDKPSNELDVLDAKQNLPGGAPTGGKGQKEKQKTPQRGLLPNDDEEKEDATLQTFDLSGLLNLETGAPAEDSDEELKSFNKLLADAMKSLKGKKKSVPVKTKKNKADSIIKELVARFKTDYTGDDSEDAEEDEEKKAAAKKKAVEAASKLITEKVYKAFGVSTAPAGKGKKPPVKKGTVKGGRGRVIKRGSRNKSQQKGNKKNEKK
jgi:hypothetical protein